MITANYSFTITDNSDVKILYLSNPEQACVLNKDGDMIKSSMGDAQLALVQAYYLKNKDLYLYYLVYSISVKIKNCHLAQTTV